MQRMLKGLLTFTFLVSAGLALADCGCCLGTKSCCDGCKPFCSTGHPYFSIRSQSINAARDLVGWQQHINKFDMEKWYGAFAITPEYTRSFKPCRIAGYLFGKDYQDGQLVVSGSRKGATTANSATGAVARGENEWLADYFGLAPNHVSTIKFTPRIQNVLIDLGLYIGFGEKWEGGFFRIHAPIAHTRWNLNMCETIETQGTLDFAMGYMSSTTLTPVVSDFATAMAGDSVWGDMQEKMKYGKIGSKCGNCCSQNKTRLSDIEMALGWNFCQDEDYHFGLMLRASAPTGNKPDACYLFEPIVGSGGHWMVGGGLTTHLVVWMDDQEEATFSVYLDANIGHYFNAKQRRSFDLKNKPNSRYMLVAEMTDTVSGLYAGSAYGTAEAPSHQYAGNLFPLINKTTCCTDVSIAFQGDMAVKLSWAKNEWSFDIGYNVWGRSGEKFKEDCCNKTCCLTEENKYVLKGDAHLYGYEYNSTNAINLAASQSQADIHSGRNTVPGNAFTTDDQKNPNVDNAQLAWKAKTATTDRLNFASLGGDFAENQTRTSLEPKFLACDDLDLCDTPKAVSHKLFVHVNYDNMNEDNEDKWNTFFGVGGEVEFGGKGDGEYSALSQWGIWLKGGVTFH